MKTFILEPNTSHKSFYGKAKVIAYDDYEVLQSYDTIVAKYVYATGTMSIYGWYSATTARHINAFLNMHGMVSRCKKQLEMTI